MAETGGRVTILHYNCHTGQPPAQQRRRHAHTHTKSTPTMVPKFPDLFAIHKVSDPGHSSFHFPPSCTSAHQTTIQLPTDTEKNTTILPATSKLAAFQNIPPLEPFPLPLPPPPQKKNNKKKSPFKKKGPPEILPKGTTPSPLPSLNPWTLSLPGKNMTRSVELSWVFLRSEAVILWQHRLLGDFQDIIVPRAPWSQLTIVAFLPCRCLYPGCHVRHPGFRS